MQGRSAEQNSWQDAGQDARQGAGQDPWNEQRPAVAGYERSPTHNPERNIVQFGPYAPPSPSRQMSSDAVHASYSRHVAPQFQPYGSANAYATEPSQDPWYSDAERAWNPEEATAPKAEPNRHHSLDRPLEPLSERLGRLKTGPELERVHSEMLDRYAEAEAEQNEEPETDWYASRIAGARSWASMENSLDTLISDYEKRHHQANVYVAGGIGGAIVLTLIALSAFLTLAG
jgi:hypothetical protein